MQAEKINSAPQHANIYSKSFPRASYLSYAIPCGFPSITIKSSCPPPPQPLFIPTSILINRKREMPRRLHLIPFSPSLPIPIGHELSAPVHRPHVLDFQHPGPTPVLTLVDDLLESPGEFGFAAKGPSLFCWCWWFRIWR